MTGFARVQEHDDALVWTWEIKSVNGRGLEVRCKLPPGYDALDLPAREIVANAFKRGNISVNLSIARSADQSAVRVNEALLSDLVALARRARERFPDFAPPHLGALFDIKGVIEHGEAEETAEAREARLGAMLDSLRKAVAALAAMREAEGRRLEDVLLAQLDEIARLAEAAGGTAGLRPEAIRARLQTQVQALLEAVPALSEERLAQEAALLAAKVDVREELDRLRAHLAAAREMIAAGAPVGRKLDFLCQEFNREANTLCSKASDVELTRIGLDLKAVIEQFREQVQNIE
ncbi:MAG: YicC family protein [Rhodospirillales bacterium]|nr:YicC family protein [Rhodospirillales bacterium]